MDASNDFIAISKHSPAKFWPKRMVSSKACRKQKFNQIWKRALGSISGKRWVAAAAVWSCKYWPTLQSDQHTLLALKLPSSLQLQTIRQWRDHWHCCYCCCYFGFAGCCLPGNLLWHLSSYCRLRLWALGDSARGGLVRHRSRVDCYDRRPSIYRYSMQFKAITGKV